MTQSDRPSGESEHAATAPTSSFSLEQYYRQKLENVRRQLPEAARQLMQAGVARVRIEYDGVGDSGQIEHVAYVDLQGEPVSPAGLITIADDRLLDLFYDLIPSTPSRLGQQRRRLRGV